MEDFKITLAKLREPFPPSAHVERPLPGGGKWFYVPWQQIRERIEEVAPDHELEFYPPEFVDAYCTVRCKLVICGVSRIAIGNAENKGGMRGNAIERAVADAYKNAAEAFGVCAYLDDQSKEKRLWTAQYLHGKGDDRAMSEAMRNGDIPGSLNRNKQKPAPAKSDAAAPATEGDPTLITEGQQKRLYAIAMSSGYTKEGLKCRLDAAGYKSSKDLPKAMYDKVCTALEDKEAAQTWNDRATGQWEEAA
jgi:Rad52/22 family double-strand break repair protein